MTEPDALEEQITKKLEDIAYWMYESSGRSAYVRADRKPLHPDEAVAKLATLFTEHSKELERLSRIDKLEKLLADREKFAEGRGRTAVLSSLKKWADNTEVSYNKMIETELHIIKSLSPTKSDGALALDKPSVRTEDNNQERSL